LYSPLPLANIIDDTAKEFGMSRNELINRCLKVVLSSNVMKMIAVKGKVSSQTPIPTEPDDDDATPTDEEPVPVVESVGVESSG
jgi:hypothetical protein